MAAEEINRIVLIVHPFLEYAVWAHSNINKLGPNERLFVKNRFDLFGRHILDAGKDKKTIAILIDAAIATEKKIGGNYKRFISFAERNMGERLVKPFHGDEGLRDALTKFRFADNVSICAMGEFFSGCVHHSAHNIQELLEKNGIKTTVEKNRGASIDPGEFKDALKNFRKWRKQSASKPQPHPKARPMKPR